MGERFESLTVGDIVALDYRAAGIFEQFGIDFCCGGRRQLAAACAAAAADPDAVGQALDGLPAYFALDEDVRDWPLGRLVDHIVSTHHRYVRAALPAAARDLATSIAEQGDIHPELKRVAALVDELTRELLQHMAKEEQVLFPYVRGLDADADVAGPCPFGTVDNPIRMMEREHAEAGQVMRTVRDLTGGYRPPSDASPVYAAALKTLEEFERDLHLHIHLENNILFPKAKERERASWQN